MNDVLPAIGLAVCLVFLARLLMPAPWLEALRRLWRRLRRPGPKARPMSEADAARMAEEAIRRARAGRPEGRWDGNVFRLRGGKRPKKPH